MLPKNVLAAMTFRSLLLHYFLNGCPFALYFSTGLSTIINKMAEGELGKVGEEERETRASSYGIIQSWE